MPGIVALITNIPSEHAVPQLLRMVDSLCHEPFYSSGTWIDESLGVYVGWVARQGSFSDRMPLRNETGSVVLVFSGEEYSDPCTSQRLRARGHEVDPDGPSYLVHRYEDEPRFLEGLNGRFHGVLADRQRETVTVFNDRFGMHRLYFHKSADGFYFAGEAKAILAVRPELRRLDARGVGEFISCGAVLENRTLFEGIEILPQAAAWQFRGAVLKRSDVYFQPKEWEEQEPLEAEEYYQELRETFTRILPRYFAGREQVGMSLTGGLDSRMILACRTPAPGSLPCYTFGSMFRENQDVRVARRVAEICKQPYQVLPVGDEFLSRFPYYAERTVYLTDGCVDVGRSPDLYLNEKARQIAPVRMTGNYGGEILRAVRAFKPVNPTPGVFCSDFLPYLHRATDTCSAFLNNHPVSFAAFQQAPWGMYGVLALEQTQLTMRSPFLDNELVRTVFRAPLSILANNDVSLRLVADGNRSLLEIPTDRGLGGKEKLGLSFVNRKILDILFKAEYAYDMGMPQWLARADHAFSSFHLERLFLGRHKPFHFRVWYRDALADYVQEILLNERALSRSYIERKRIEAVVRAHVKGIRNYTNELHKLLTLEIFQRLFLDRAPLETRCDDLVVSAIGHEG